MVEITKFGAPLGGLVRGVDLRSIDDAEFAAAAFQFAAALKRSLDVVLVTEHIDESLMLMGRRAGWGPTDLLYISQKRRKQDTGKAGAVPATTAVPEGKEDSSSSAAEPEPLSAQR